MSAIDTVNHAHIENFFGLPVYWVLQETQMSNITDSTGDNDKFLNHFFISVGGGSGEHPALILNNDALVLNLLKNLKEIEKSDKIDSKIYELSEKIQEKYLTNHKDDIYFWKLDQNQWPLDTFIRIHKEMNQINKNTQAFEERMKDAFAMLIIEKMPLKACLKDADLIEIATLIRENKHSSLLDNIQENAIGFTGVEHKSGRTIVNKNVVWGYSLDDWKKDNNSYELSEKLSSELPVKKISSKVKI